MPTNPLSTLAAAELAALLAPVNDSLDKLIATPTPLNVAAQFAALQGNLIGAAPVLETVGISGLAAFLKMQLAAFQASLVAPAVAPKSAA